MISELIRKQQEFETPRGLDKQGMVGRLYRWLQEWEEAMVEAKKGDNEALLWEVADLNIFAASMFGELCTELGIAPEQIDNMLEEKMKINNQKYQIHYFEDLPTERAVELARYVWHYDPPDWGSNDVY
jgi:phosphoribosyl-ATP pyrophosphohydrolase